MSSFSDFKLLPSLLTSLTEQGLTRPTEIQARTLTPLLKGQSLVGVSETGSGKTLAYVLPMLHQLKLLDTEKSAVSLASRPRGLVLVPARELGEQVSKVFKSMTHGTRLRVRSVLGGTHKQIARQSISGAVEILVATPGRLEQILADGKLRLDDVRMVVFDEADQLLDHSFLPATKRIINACPARAQLAMFSATAPESQKKAIGEFFNTAPLRVRTRGSQQLVSTLETDNRRVFDGRRLEMLLTVLDEDSTLGTLIFANTRQQCDTIAEHLEGVGIPHVRYMGEMDRAERRRNLRRFREEEVSILIATDLGGRGLDIEYVERVINAHLPTELDNYLHRAGRTARAGRKGLVVNLVTERDQPLFTKLKKREAKRG